jgi:hypothetical protein
MNKILGISILVLSTLNATSKSNVAFGIGGFLLASYLHEYKGFKVFDKFKFKKPYVSKEEKPSFEIKLNQPASCMDKGVKYPFISRKKELMIVDDHRHIVNKFYKSAVVENSTKYTYHPVYINGEKNVLSEYCDTVIGVSVIDNLKTGSSDNISDAAIITDIVGVGGIDRFNRGEIDNKKENKGRNEE